MEYYTERLAALDSLTLASIYGKVKKMPYLFKLLADLEYVYLNVGTYREVGFHGTLDTKAGSLNLNILAIWGRIILCHGSLSCAL